MKKSLKNVLTMLICAATSLAIAGSNPEVSVIDAGQKSFALYINNVESNFVYVSLKDKHGQVLLNDRVKRTDAFARKYNLVNLPAGEYSLLIEDGSKTVTQPIIVDAKALVIPENQMTTVFAPAVQLSNNKLDFTMLCLNETAVTIVIVDDQGRTDYTATTTEQGSVQRRFDISALGSGQYTLITKLKGASFEKEYREIFTLGAEVAGN